MKKLGCSQSSSDPCIYIASGGERFILGVYVDDIMLAIRSSVELQEVKKKSLISKTWTNFTMKVVQDEATMRGQPTYRQCSAFVWNGGSKPSCHSRGYRS